MCRFDSGPFLPWLFADRKGIYYLTVKVNGPAGQGIAVDIYLNEMVDWCIDPRPKAIRAAKIGVKLGMSPDTSPTREGHHRPPRGAV